MEPQSSGTVPKRASKRERAPKMRLRPEVPRREDTYQGRNSIETLRAQDPVAFHRLVEQSMGSEVASRVRPAPEVLRQHEQAEAEQNEALAPSASPFWDYFPSKTDPIELLPKWQQVRIHGLEKKPEFNNLL